jgi:hypothetical protein
MPRALARTTIRVAQRARWNVASHEILVRFARPIDPDDALVALAAHGLTAIVEPERSEIAIGCRAGDEESILNAASHALEEWLLVRGLPFVPVRDGARTLIVRPPAD